MITIIDCGISNLHSITKAVEIVGGDVCVSNKAKDIEKAERIVLPGVGTFKKGMENLRKLGLIEVLNEQVLKRRKPFLGICLGMQLLARKGSEYGISQGLGWLPAVVKPFESDNKDLKIPHMGWDDVVIELESSLFSRIGKNSTFYFVHSYYIIPDTTKVIVATCDYGLKFAAAILQDNIFAVQFHPEKSQKNGLTLLKNFIDWKV